MSLCVSQQDGGGNCYYNETKYLSSAVYSFINVVDVPDLDPRFVGLPYIATVQEHSSLVSAGGLDTAKQNWKSE